MKEEKELPPDLDSKDLDTNPKKYSYVIFRSLLGGLNNTISKIVVTNLAMYHYLFLRYLGIFIISLLLNKHENTLKKDLKLLFTEKKLMLSVLSSSILSCIGMLLFYNALSSLPVSIVSVYENGIYMVFTVLLSFIFLKERKSPKIYLFILFIVVGLFLVVTKGNINILELDISALGLLFLTLNALVSSIETIITASNLKRLGILTLLIFKMGFSIIFSVILIIFSDEKTPEFISAFTWYLALLLIYLIVSSFIIKYLQSKSIISIGSGTTSIFNSLTPLVSSFFGMIVFSEWFNVYQYIGMFIIMYSLLKVKKLTK